MQIEAIDIVISSGGCLVCFLLGYWFNRLNKSQDETNKKIEEIKISEKEHEMNIKRIDSETRMLRKENEKLDIKLKEETLGLQKDMRVMSVSVGKLLKTTMVHDIEIKNTKIDIEELREQNRYISEYIRGDIHGKKLD
jgi:hypothetical protein